MNSSSPDRGWKVAFETWDRIKEKVPQAELHLFYGLNNLKIIAQRDPSKAKELEYYENKLKEFEGKGIIYHGRVNEDKLIEEYLSAGVWAHGSNFTETFCITAAQAQLAGLRTVTSACAALNETVGSYGTLIEGDCNLLEYQNKFIDNVIQDLLKPEDESERLELRKTAEQRFCLDILAKEWETMFYQLIEDKKVNPLIPYQPTVSFK